MAMPERIQLKRSKGWRMPPNTVKVDRTTRWGNPYRVGMPGVPDRATAVALFRVRSWKEVCRQHLTQLSLHTSYEARTSPAGVGSQNHAMPMFC